MTVSENGTFQMPQTDVTCTFVNTALQASVMLTKVWVDGVQGDTAGLSISSPGGATGTSSSTSTGAPGTVTDSAKAASATVSQGAQVTLAETLDPKAGTYTTTFACTGVTPVDGVFQMPTTGNVDCTVTNTAATGTVTLTKTWVGGVAGDAANLSIAIPGAPTSRYVSTATGGNQTDTTGATATVPQGSQVTVGENLDPSKGSYTAKYECTDSFGALILSDSNGFAMPAGDVSCVATNTAATGTVTLTKTWVRGVAGDTAHLTIAVPGTPDATYASTAVGGAQTDKTGATATVSTGSTVTVGETIDPSKGSYTFSYTCTADQGALTLSGNAFTMPGGNVNCVVTNTAPVPVPVTPVTPGMANTGSNILGPLGLGGILLALGAGLVFWMRRRRLLG